jgi:alpha-2-macroglobulin
MKSIINQPLILKEQGKLTKIFVIIFLTGLFSLTGCHQKPKEVIPDPAFSKYIASFTSGEISVEAPILVQLTDIPEGLEPGSAVPQGLFRFKPDLAGETIFLSGGTFRFNPASPMNPGTQYTATFALDKLIEVEKKLNNFVFSFSTISQNFTVEEDGLFVSPTLVAGLMSWSGKLTTADVANPSKIKELVTATYDNKTIPLKWTNTPDRRSFTFMADSLERHSTLEKNLTLKWDGKQIDVKESGEISVPVPSRNQFKILNVKTHTSPGQQVIITFSDPLQVGRPIDGMVEIEGNKPFTWQIDANRMILWPTSQITGQLKLSVFKGMKSADGTDLKETNVFSLIFRNQKPAIRLLGKGVIVPGDGRLSFPFEAVSLKAVDLRIIKIYASNIRQFLQENTFDGSSDVKKVGRLVYSGKVDLQPDKQEKLYQWNTYRIDLNRYIALEKGAIYRVELRFRKAYSLYDCQETVTEEPSEEIEIIDDNWDSPGWYSLYYWPQGFDWQQRENPCHISYFTSERFVSRNIFASNLGIIGKEGKSYNFTFAVTNLTTAMPEEKAEISLFDYQHQPMGKTVTDNRGMATIALSGKPFVAVVTKGNQTGYLRIDDGSSLSLSNFDVTGQEVQAGIKGFLYGERGVWRPGDKLFLTFILDDPAENLPSNTPVIFRLTNSRGQEVNRQVSTSSENGFYHFPVTTLPDDPTGNWYARVQVGGASFEQRIKVEAVKPNRLKIDLKLPQTIVPGSRQTAGLTSAWLHGAPAPSLKAIVETELFAVKTTFKGFEKYSFDNPGTVFSPSKKTIFDGRLNDRGIASIPLDFQAESNAPGKLRAWFTTRVFEEGGDFSINVQNTEYSPYQKYIGIRMPDSSDEWYKTDTDYEPEIIVLTPDGKPAAIGKIEISLYKIDWRWWWESGEDELARYVSGRHYQPVQKWTIDEKGNSAKIKLNVTYRDWRDNGRYLLYARNTESGHATGTTFYMSQWGSWRNNDMPDGATILSLQTDKEKYAPGEKIRVTLPSSKQGRALVSLENGHQVKDILWVETSENETTFDIEVKPGMAPTLYMFVSLIQPYGNLNNDAPIRLYGVKGVTVEDPQTVLKPIISVKDELEPEKDFTITVSETDGRPMTYTLAIVDEGLLDLTNFGTPDPHRHFYAREALGVKTYDLFDFVAGAYGAQLEKAFAVGGDQDKVASGKKQANRFDPVVLYAGPFTLSKGGKKTHNLRMPNYVGSVKAMVVAGDKGAYGNTDKEIKVRKAVMLLATLPRVAGPGEEITLPVTVFAMKETTRNVTVEVETNEMFSVEGNRSQSLTFSEIGDKMAMFNLKAAKKTGIGKVKITARSGNETATYEVEMDIRNPNPPVVVSENRLLEPGEKWEAEITSPGTGIDNESYLELATLPGLNISRHFGELIQYPHGCTEQTVSGALAQLYIDNLAELSAQEKFRTEENIRAAIQKLRSVQTVSGGFAYWPGQNAADDWSTSYAGHFITLAAQKGYPVPEDMKNRWIVFQRNRAREWKSAAGADPFIRQQEALIQAYRLYTLALAGSPEQGVMNRFREEVGNHAQAKWRLAAAFVLSGQPAAATQLLSQAQTTTEAYPHHGPTFGSQLRDKAMILETLLLMNDRRNAFPLLQEMAHEIGESNWISTQTAGWCFYSIAKFYSAYKPEGGLDATVTMNGKTEKHRSELPVVKLQALSDRQDKVKATIVNNGQSPLFVQMISRGTPAEDTAGAVENNLQMTIWHTDRNGNRINPAELEQGADLFLNVTVKHPGIRGPYRQLALSTIFPSGWEILNRRLSDMPENQQQAFDYQDIRDDRVYSYFGLAQGESRTFRIALNAAYKGRFYAPAIVCEAMYDNTIHARQPGRWVKVK